MDLKNPIFKTANLKDGTTFEISDVGVSFGALVGLKSGEKTVNDIDENIKEFDKLQAYEMSSAMKLAKEDFVNGKYEEILKTGKR